MHASIGHNNYRVCGPEVRKDDSKSLILTFGSALVLDGVVVAH